MSLKPLNQGEALLLLIWVTVANLLTAVYAWGHLTREAYLLLPLLATNIMANVVYLGLFIIIRSRQRRD